MPSTERGEVMQALSVVRLRSEHPGFEAAVGCFARPRVEELHDGGDHAAGCVHYGSRACDHVVTD